MDDQLQLFNSQSSNLYTHLNKNLNPSCFDRQIQDMIANNKIYSVLNPKCNGFNLNSRSMLAIYTCVLLDKNKLVRMFLNHRSGLCKGNETIFVAHCTDTYNKTYVYVDWSEPKRLTGRNTLMFEDCRPIVYALRHVKHQDLLIGFVKSRDDQYKFHSSKQNDHLEVLALVSTSEERIKAIPSRNEQSHESNGVVIKTRYTNSRGEDKSELRNDEVKDEYSANNSIVESNEARLDILSSEQSRLHLMNNKPGDAVSLNIKISADTVFKLKQLRDVTTPTWSISTITHLLEFDIPSNELTCLFSRAQQYLDPEEGFITDSNQDITTQEIFMLFFLRQVMDDLTMGLLRVETNNISVTLLVNDEIRTEYADVLTLLSAYLTLICDSLYVLTEKFPRISVCCINCC